MYVHAFAPQEGVPGGDENASPYYVLAAQRRSPPPSEGSEGANVLALRVGIFQYNNVLVLRVRRDTGSFTTPTGNLQDASLTTCNSDGWTLLNSFHVLAADST